MIVATATNLLSTGLTDSLLSASDYLSELSAHQSQVATGSLLQFVSAVAGAGIAVSLYPVLKNHSEGLALGSVTFRIIESVFYLVAELALLSLLWLGQEHEPAGSAASSTYQLLGDWTLAVRNWANFAFGVLSFCVGAAIYYYLLYRAQLVPRWLSAWGLAALALLGTMAILIVFGQEPAGKTLLLALPIATQEMALAAWLIIKGFNPTASEDRARTLVANPPRT